MIVHKIVGSESHPSYQTLEIENLARQYDLLRSVFRTAKELGYAGLSHDLLKALNSHAISCLHEYAGVYRPPGVEVRISDSDHVPPESSQVLSLMNGMVDDINRAWTEAHPITLAAYTLWRLNWIHPFVNGNGRTARAACYLVLCLKAGVWFPGSRILPELIRETRDEYVIALRDADARALGGKPDVSALHSYLAAQLERQLTENGAADATEPPAD